MREPVAMILAVRPAHQPACKPRAPSVRDHIRSGMISCGTIARQPPARNVSTTWKWKWKWKWKSRRLEGGIYLSGSESQHQPVGPRVGRLDRLVEVEVEVVQLEILVGATIIIVSTVCEPAEAGMVCCERAAPGAGLEAASSAVT
jgi:hypothetical protein